MQITTTNSRHQGRPAQAVRVCGMLVGWVVPEDDDTFAAHRLVDYFDPAPAQAANAETQVIGRYPSLDVAVGSLAGNAVELALRGRTARGY